MRQETLEVREFYEEYPCGGEEDAGDERGRLYPWWDRELRLDVATGSVLEVACGAGLDLSRLAKSSETAVGIDLAQRPLTVARERLHKQGSEALLSRAQAQALPFREATFEGVLCVGALHHMVEWEEAISECSRVLKPGGAFTFLVYRRFAFQTLFFALGRVLRPVFARLLHGGGRVLRRKAAVAEFTIHPLVKFLPEEVWLRAARQVGLEIASVSRRDAWFPFDRLFPALRHTSFADDSLGRFLIVRGRRV
ncbi:MAG TPA: class I SAM-dependent methyltransferase [Actinomycetota bacterium]|nr:class I SAM-dependent methyltransferase [Actinomycetota bacterium]